MPSTPAPVAKAVAWANYVRKALLSAVAVASTIVVLDVPQTAKTIAAAVIAVGGVFGVVYKVENKAKP